jgi:hypothetical protein
LWLRWNCGVHLPGWAAVGGPRPTLDCALRVRVVASPQLGSLQRYQEVYKLKNRPADSRDDLVALIMGHLANVVRRRTGGPYRASKQAGVRACMTASSAHASLPPVAWPCCPWPATNSPPASRGTTTHTTQAVDEDETLIRFAIACRRNGQRLALNGVKKARASSVSRPRAR